ncbi:ABC transporter ATP-binding protein [Ruminococcus flavefaciens]|uniref:Iron complex transport system ATP-binding protein n=1 Tax=Ruminococcus flavefaciens TaxID=1265 RepID=A0A1K1NM08_RUMFL|nr:ABC transporter ATP-binding protein [Ruminococcus flavefaciens]SFW35454.1 iron complex transport system ATP-binding protein [Ruminococcus flavefaciens]
MSEMILTAKALSAGYGKKVVVDGLNIGIRTGEILTIIGPNGAGKSTVLKSIASQLPLLGGEVFINDTDITSMSLNDIAKKLSVCFTDRITAEKMTCEDIISTGRYPYTGMLGILSSDDKKIVREAMELTGVAHLADTDIRCISDGQRQTVMLARAIAQEPQVLILDEPTSFLDINNKLRLLTILRELVHTRNIAVVQTLHELDLAQRFSDKILCIAHGKAERTGTPEEIFSGSYISELYGISCGTFDTLFGTAEAQRTEGEPQVFVIGGGGSGIPIYRRLQRRSIPFAAGVIHENDVEYNAAKSLAAELIAEKAFEPISDESFDKALSVMQKCREVICCVQSFGAMNAGNKNLLEKAKSMGIFNNSDEF